MFSKRSFMAWLLILSALIFGILPITAQDAPPDPDCPGAPAPRLAVEGSGRVLPGDANNVRDQPSRSGSLVGAIPGSVEFTVLEGPVCADSLNWWRVRTDDVTGWTVEGSGSDYWIEPLFQPAAPVEWVNGFRDPGLPIANPMVIGAIARVQTMDGNPLPVYAEPDDAIPVSELPVNTLVTLIEDSAGGWWLVESDDGITGWVREAIPHTGRKPYMRPTLAPICPYTENRVLFLARDPLVGADVYTVGRDSLHLCNLSYGLQRSFEVYDWSPDGQWIAYSAVLEGSGSCAFGCSGELYVESVDGRILRRLTVDKHSGHIQWSPDGDWIAVQMDGDRPRTRDIRLIAPDGSAERTLFTTSTGFALMRWSPDGKKLAVNVDESTSAGLSKHLYVFDVETGDSRIILISDWRIDSLNWSPDSALLIVTTYIGRDARARLLEINVTDGEYEELLSGDTRGAVYSPDGTRIAFWRTELNVMRHVEVLDRATGDITRLATLLGVNGRGLSWMPEGDALLVGSSGVMRVDASTGALRSLFVGDFSSNWYPPLVQPE